MNKLSWTDFEKIDMRVGTIIDVRDFPEAKNPAYKLLIDFGETIGVKKSSAQITALYKKADLINKQVAAVINFHPKQIANLISEVLVVGFPDANNQPILLSPDKKVKNGGKLY